MDLSMLTYWTIRQRLLGVPGVANIAIWGEQLKMLQVMVDPKRLTAAGVTLDAYLFWGAEYWMLREQSGDASYMQAFARILESA